jgi:tRNA1(Val) A37 N6-methylase TrmN6
LHHPGRFICALTPLLPGVTLGGRDDATAGPPEKPEARATMQHGVVIRGVLCREEPTLQITQDHLLNRRVAYAQPATGFRTGVEPVLLAAAVPARPGERVLEAGTGAGAALLCLAARVPDLHGVGIDCNASLIALAVQNAAANGAAGLAFIVADMAAMPDTGRFDHALANPPYHAADGTASPLRSRKLAKQGDAGLLATWAHALAIPLRHRGTLTFILPAASLPPCFAAMAAAGCPPDAVLPLWPKPGRPAKLALARGVKGGRSPLRLLPGLVLHEPNGAFSKTANAVLRDGAALEMT